MTEMLPEEIQKMIQASVEKSVRKIIEEQSVSRIQLVTIEELTKILKVTKPTIHNWRKKGIIPAIHIGGRVLFNLEDVMKAIEQHNHQKGKRTNKKNL
jgi:excisionase family DNA binding protein